MAENNVQAINEPKKRAPKMNFTMETRALAVIKKAVTSIIKREKVSDGAFSDGIEAVAFASGANEITIKLKFGEKAHTGPSPKP
jgi:hypothetical protein